ncbi:MAG TPA: GNAT family N-acetyltransferase [Acidimicrobiales bacterium]|nr:GNAT family N-acetyltransferase [Acidimicrobiales bacterium]
MAGDVIAVGAERARTGPWRGDQLVALLTPVPDAPIPSAAFVRRCLSVLADRGYRRVVTGALAPAEQAGFLAAGFAIAEELHLLAHDLRALPPRPKSSLRRARSDDHAAVLQVDDVSFTPFWRLDDAGLTDTLAATPHVRFRVAHDPLDHVVGYAITGRAGRRGYLQRLAVAPNARDHGLGAALVVDGLWWLRRWRVNRALVNTQHGNQAALALYTRLGFRPEPVGLSVLEAACGD